MSTHRYILEPYKTAKSRYQCPGCKHSNKTFKRYIDTQTNQHLADHVGRCDREDSCGYHFTPKQFFAANPNRQQAAYKPLKPSSAPPPSSISFNLVDQSLKHYHLNNFHFFLGELFDQETRQRLVEQYNLGTSNHWPGACIFWQIDVKGQARTGKIMLYHPTTGKRVKQPYNHITWVHKQVNQPNYELKQCLFGEHLLAEQPDKKVALVESEKTAMIAAGAFPEYLWLAAGSLSGLTVEKCAPLKGREVMLCPDVNAFQKWYDKATELNLLMPGTKFNILSMLERQATPEQRARGIDIADIYIEEKEKEWAYERELGLRE